MIIPFSDLITKITKKEKYNESYYNIGELRNVLNICDANEILIADDCFLSPFYVNAESTYNIHWLDFSITHVNESNMDMVLSERARGVGGKDIVKLLYVEILYPNISFPITRLQDYVNFLYNSDEVKEEVILALGKQDENFKFDANNLYLTVY